jgi:hypothetical protein
VPMPMEAFPTPQMCEDPYARSAQTCSHCGAPVTSNGLTEGFYAVAGSAAAGAATGAVGSLFMTGAGAAHNAARKNQMYRSVVDYPGSMFAHK